MRTTNGHLFLAQVTDKKRTTDKKRKPSGAIIQEHPSPTLSVLEYVYF